MIDYGTSFVETEALLAASEGDDETLLHTLTHMTRQERERLRAAAHRLIRMIDQQEQSHG